MKKQLKRYVRKRKIHLFRKRLVSIISCLVVFCTTYALILPAITLERSANCGYEEHQHDDGCYEERLICGREEIHAHHHTDECYRIERELICTKEEHVHDEGCFDKEGNLTCAFEEHSHGDECYREDRILSCSLEETEGHTHTPDCYEKVLTCGKPAHVHTAECFLDDEEQAVSSESSEPAALDRILTEDTSLWVLPPDAGEYGWNKITEETILGADDLVRLYFAYRIPAGTLDDSNEVFRYSLPENIVLTEQQIEEINAGSAGLGAQAVDGIRTPDRAPEGDEYVSANFRIEFPDMESSDMENSDIENIEMGNTDIENADIGNADIENFEMGNTDTENSDIENIDTENSDIGYPDGKNENLSQEVILTFNDYTVEKNRRQYGENGEMTDEGEEVAGFFSIDVNTDQILFEEISKDTHTDAIETEDGTVDRTVEETVSEAEIVLARGDEETGAEEIRNTIRLREERTVEETLRTKEENAEEDESQGYTVEDGPEEGRTGDESASEDESEEGVTEDADTADEDLEEEDPEINTGEGAEENAAGEAGTAEGSLEDETPEINTGEDAEENTEENAAGDFGTAEGSLEENAAGDAGTGEGSLEEAADGDAGTAEEGTEEAAVGEVGTSAAETQKDTSPVSDASVSGNSGEEKHDFATGALTFEGPDYTVKASFDKEAGIPSGSSLSVSELTQEDSSYQEYRDQAEKAVIGNTAPDSDFEESTESGSDEVVSSTAAGPTAAWVRLFDIKIVDREGEKVEIQAPVKVSIDLAEAVDSEGSESADGDAGEESSESVDRTAIDESDGSNAENDSDISGISDDIDSSASDEGREVSADMRVIHFADGEETGNVIDTVKTTSSESMEDGITLSFETDGFSIYAIVDVVDSATSITAEEFGGDDPDGQILLISNMRSATEYYLMNSSKNAEWMNHSAELKNAQPYKFNKITAGENEGKYTVSFVDDSGKTQYLKLTTSTLSLSEDPYYFTITKNNGVWLFQMGDNSDNYINHNDGKGFGRWKNGYGDPGNCLILRVPPVVPNDTLGLDGKTYGFLNYKDGAYATAMMSSAHSSNPETRLAAQSVLIRTDPMDRDTNLFIAEDSEISMWTFMCVEGNRYHITTTVDGQTKYLKVTNKAVTLVDTADDDCLLTVTAGKGNYAGKFRITGPSGYSPNLYNGNVSSGFGSYHDSGPNEWFNLAELSNLTEDDFVLYSASKVSVSDRLNVANGNQVVVYTRSWNDTAKKYDYYAIDHNGDLVPAYEIGDSLQWVGLGVNNMLWNFTEHYETGTDTPNFYYDLQNAYSGQYLSPRIAGNQILSDEQVGINLDGRRDGKYYSSILAWDEDQYNYSGYKVEDGKLVACPMAEAMDFFFAVMDPVTDQLTTVDTVDNDDYGITMKMQNYNGQKTDGGKYDKTQTDVMGDKGDTKGLVKPYLEEDGYPVAAKTERSLSELFSDTTSVNHLFLQSTYNETGYFEYNCTENFAHLNDDGNFTVYDQIGTIESGNLSLDHGQFMPYNDLTPGLFSQKHINITDETDAALPDTHPRKGEALHAIPADEAVFHFGMDLEAKFTQTASGKDAWGHDIIFEFAGDDDMFFYVDGVQILDLGGNHKAFVGKVNFRTGEVTYNRGSNVKTNLRTLFEASYRAQYPDVADEAVNAWLEEHFEPGESVFRDYSTHSMRMIYMERGAGASNLHMRFNLAAVKKGTFILSKKLSGTDSPSNNLIECPYQIYYKLDGQEDYQLLQEITGNAYNVLYAETTRKVTYKQSFTPAGGDVAYTHVFFLKPGESAQVKLPEDTIAYYVVECGVNPDVFTEVKANDLTLQGTGTQNYVGTTARKDYKTLEDTLEHRSIVDYDNTVNPEAMRTLSFTKKLYDADGETLLQYPANSTLFDFRVYLGTENADADRLPLVDMYSYYVKDPNGYYCQWDSSQAKFVRTAYNTYAGLSTYLESLTNTQKETIIFKTSMNGAISKIPADYTVEIRDLIVGTQWKVEERDNEIPRGYTRREGDGYVRTEPDDPTKSSTPISGTIQVREDPKLEVRNQKGWGLTVKKVWTDKDFMDEHDPIYFGIYLNGTLVEGTVRQMSSSDTEIYYFFDDLKDAGGTVHQFSDFTVREVTIGNGSPTVTEEGLVSDPGTVTPIDQGGTLSIGGKPVGGEYTGSGYNYTVNYEVGEITGKNENIRTDTVTNSRPGVGIYKTDWNSAALAGAVFTLKDSEGDDVGASTYTSDSEGLVTFAYLSDGTYTLTETAAPKGYTVLPESVTITVDSGSVSVSGPDSSFYTLTQNDNGGSSGMLATLTIKNMTSAFKAVKVDSAQNTPIGNVHFALYRQVSDAQGNKKKDYTPLYADLVTDENGIIPDIDLNLKSGTYYLTETLAAPNYDLLTKDVIFTIGSDGTVTVESEGHSGWMTSSSDTEGGEKSYTLTIPNGKAIKVSVWKTDADSNTITTGASFALYRAVDYDDDAGQPKTDTTPVLTGTTAENGILTLGDLASGEYRLVETAAPDGYMAETSAIKITVDMDSGVTAIQGSGYAEVTRKGDAAGHWVAGQDDSTWQIQVVNNTGYELPSTGGPGTRTCIVSGVLLSLLACLGLALQSQRF